MNYYILCPWAESGGPEGLHQLCYELVNLGKNAKIVYYHPWTDKIQSEYSGKICGRYIQYSGIESFTPENISDIDYSNNIIVLPEVCRIRHVEMFKKAKVVYLRLSNNTKETALDPQNYDSLTDPAFQNCYTACDPFLVYKRIKESNQYNMNNVFMLRPNINLSYIFPEKDLKKERKNVVLFSPARGKEHIDNIIKVSKNFDIDFDIDFVPLQGMSQEELKNIISTSKLYVEFGHLPGPDRLSRESASGGCVVLMGKRGSGADQDDFPIDEKLDWDESNNTFDYGKICSMIIDIIKNYDKYFKKQKSYREILRNERTNYIDQLKNMISVLENN